MPATLIAPSADTLLMWAWSDAVVVVDDALTGNVGLTTIEDEDNDEEDDDDDDGVDDDNVDAWME